MSPSRSSRAITYLLVSAACTVTPRSSPSSDVRSDLSRRGFGLSSLTGGNTRTAVYFDKTWQDIRLDSCCAWGGIEIATDGTLIGGNSKQFVVLSPDGRRRASFPEPAYTSQITWNHRTDTIAAIVVDNNTKRLVLEYWPFGSQRFTVVAPIEQPNSNAPLPTISWSPDGSAIAYSTSTEIFVYTLSDRKKLVIAEGTNPAWSPSGDWIAFQDKRRRACVVNTRNHSSRVLIPDAQIRWGVRWSPDSKYVLVTVLRPRASFHEETEFQVYRVSDGKMIRIDPLIGGTTEDRVFWVEKPGR